MSEQVLCFPAYLLNAFGGFPGGVKFLAEPMAVGMGLGILLAPDSLEYIDRASAEKDPSWKQVIPYCVLRLKGTSDVFVYQRTKKGGENRLHDKWTVGVGGHINPCDGEPGYFAYQAAFVRELREEVGLAEGSYEDRVIGLLYDDSDEVGRVHFGVVHEVTVSKLEDLRFNDPSLAGGHFIPLDALRAGDQSRFEKWSQYVISNLSP